MALVTKPTLGLHYTNVTPHPAWTAKISGISKLRSVLLFILSISELGLDETGEPVLRCVLYSSTSPEHTLLSLAAVLFFLSCVLFGVKLLFLLLRTRSSILIGEKAQSILPVKWQRGWQKSSGLISMAVGSPQLDATMRQKTTRDEIRGNTADEHRDRNCRGVADNT